MVFEGITHGRIRKTFKVLSVNGQDDSCARFNPTSAIRIVNPDEEVETAKPTGGVLQITNVPGLSHEIKVLNNFLRGFSRRFWGRGERESCGFVIHGGHGTGKTFILQQIENTNWGRTHWIKGTDKLASIRETFTVARAQQPSLVFIDSLDDLLGKDRANRETVIEAISDELDNLSRIAQENQALPQTIVIAVCSDYMVDVPAKLQKRQRFRKNIALPIPAGPERLEILKFLDPPINPEEKEKAMETVAQKTHAYNGDDLATLISNAWEILDARLFEEGVDVETSGEQLLTTRDLVQALTVTRASAMHDINLKPPTIHWRDVGGQENLKKVLSRMIKNTKVSKHPVPFSSSPN